MRTIDSILGNLHSPRVDRLEAPEYCGTSSKGIALAVESMRMHTTDEGWQVMAGLESAGYTLCGHQLTVNVTDVEAILRQTMPGVCVVQDKREWDVQRGCFREPLARFERVDALRERPDIFKLTILKDSHQNPHYHRGSAEEIGCHAWITYYHPRVVRHLAPYIRPEHCVRTYHSLDSQLIPPYNPKERHGCLLSGAISGAYPLRTRLFKEHRLLPDTVVLPHPGYHRNGTATPDFLRMLSRFKVAICTSSIYGYALRKMMEATACGCVVVTDLPEEEELPEIDGNLVRIPPTKSTAEIGDILQMLYREYEPEVQAKYAEKARAFYDYRVAGKRLAASIEHLRSKYPCC